MHLRKGILYMLGVVIGWPPQPRNLSVLCIYRWAIEPRPVRKAGATNDHDERGVEHRQYASGWQAVLGQNMNGVKITHFFWCLCHTFSGEQSITNCCKKYECKLYYLCLYIFCTFLGAQIIHPCKMLDIVLPFFFVSLILEFSLLAWWRNEKSQLRKQLVHLEIKFSIKSKFVFFLPSFWNFTSSAIVKKRLINCQITCVDIKVYNEAIPFRKPHTGLTENVNSPMTSEHHRLILKSKVENIQIQIMCVYILCSVWGP
jgi:hypothetical protein